MPHQSPQEKGAILTAETRSMDSALVRRVKIALRLAQEPDRGQDGLVYLAQSDVRDLLSLLDITLRDWLHMDTCRLKYGGSRCTCGLQSDAPKWECGHPVRSEMDSMCRVCDGGMEAPISARSDRKVGCKNFEIRDGRGFCRNCGFHHDEH